MNMTDDQRREAAAALVEAERTCNWIEPITLTYPGADIEDAYAIGQYVTEVKVRAGRVIKGHKVGLTSKAMRSTSGATEPDYGTIFDNWFVDEGSHLFCGLAPGIVGGDAEPCGWSFLIRYSIPQLGRQHGESAPFERFSCSCAEARPSNLPRDEDDGAKFWSELLGTLYEIETRDQCPCVER